MSLTGMLMALFLLVHMAGNLMILVSHEKYNEYSHLLTSNKALLYSAEGGLIVLVLLHIWMAIKLTRWNRASRPIPYVAKTNTGRSRRTWWSSRMGLTGTFVLLFIIFHLWHFKFGTNFGIVQNNIEMRDLARLVHEDFQTFYAWIYIAALVVIGMHLAHGFRSLFSTLGLENSRWERCVLRLTQIYVLVVFGGFILVPLAIWIQGGAL